VHPAVSAISFASLEHGDTGYPQLFETAHYCGVKQPATVAVFFADKNTEKLRLCFSPHFGFSPRSVAALLKSAVPNKIK
jgi:hypothetical protein